MAPFKSKQELVPVMPRPEGRPSEYRPEFCALVIEQARTFGTSLPAFAGVVGVAINTVYEWRKRHSEFAEACSRAQGARMLWWELKLGRSRKGAETQASMFALRNIAPDEWRDVRSVQHEHHHDIHKLTSAQLHAIAAGKAAGDGKVIDGEFWHSERSDTR